MAAAQNTAAREGARPQTCRIATDGVPKGRIGAIVARGGLTVTETDGVPDGADVLVMDPMTTQRLEAVVNSPIRGFVEFREEEEPLARRIVTAAGSDGLYLALTTPTAFNQVDTAKVVCDALVARGALPLHMRANVEMALHETVANGILHGNLRTNIGMKDDTEFYAAFCDHLKDLLDNADVHRRWIEISASWNEETLDIAVEDEGDGYDPGGTASDAPEPVAHGRGLAIVSALASEVTVSHGGRRTSLRFAYEC